MHSQLQEHQTSVGSGKLLSPRHSQPRLSRYELREGLGKDAAYKPIEANRAAKTNPVARQRRSSEGPLPRLTTLNTQADISTARTEVPTLGNSVADETQEPRITIPPNEEMRIRRRFDAFRRKISPQIAEGSQIVKVNPLTERPIGDVTSPLTTEISTQSLEARTLPAFDLTTQLENLVATDTITEDENKASNIDKLGRFIFVTSKTTPRPASWPGLAGSLMAYKFNNPPHLGDFQSGILNDTPFGKIRDMVQFMQSPSSEIPVTEETIFSQEITTYGVDPGLTRAPLPPTTTPSVQNIPYCSETPETTTFFNTEPPTTRPWAALTRPHNNVGRIRNAIRRRFPIKANAGQETETISSLPATVNLISAFVNSPVSHNLASVETLPRTANIEPNEILLAETSTPVTKVSITEVNDFLSDTNNFDGTRTSNVNSIHKNPGSPPANQIRPPVNPIHGSNNVHPSVIREAIEFDWRKLNGNTAGFSRKAENNEFNVTNNSDVIEESTEPNIDMTTTEVAPFFRAFSTFMPHQLQNI